MKILAVCKKGAIVDYILGQIVHLQYVSEFRLVCLSPLFWFEMKRSKAIQANLFEKNIKFVLEPAIPFFSHVSFSSAFVKTVVYLTLLCAFPVFQRFPSVAELFEMMWHKALLLDRRKTYLHDISFANEVWFEWSKFTPIVTSFFKLAQEHDIRIRVMPDALIAEGYTVTEEMKSLFKDKRVTLTVHDPILANQLKVEFENADTKINCKPYRHSIWARSNDAHDGCRVVRILYLAQKVGAGASTHEAISLDRHKQRLREIKQVLTMFEQNMDFEIIYRRQNQPTYFSATQQMLRYGKRIGLNMRNGTPSSLFEYLSETDIVVSEFTSAFQFTKSVPHRIMYKDRSYLHFNKIPVIRAQYTGDEKAGAIIEEVALPKKLRSLIQTVIENRPGKGKTTGDTNRTDLF